MLTENERNELQQQLNELAAKVETKRNELHDLDTFIQTNISVWLKKRFAKLTSQLEVSACIQYGFGDYNEETHKYERVPTIVVCINCLKDGKHSTTDTLQLNIKENETEYSGWSFRFTKAEVQTVRVFKILNSMMNCEEEFRAYCFEMIPTHINLSNELSEVNHQHYDIERQLENDDDERKEANALELLKEGAVYSDGAGEGWFLKVTKISNKLVKCQTAKEYGGWDNLPRAVYFMDVRNIKKEDFIRRLATEYYKPVDVEIRNY